MSTKTRVVVRRLPSPEFLIAPEQTPAWREDAQQDDDEYEEDEEEEEEMPMHRMGSPMSIPGPFVFSPKTNKLKLTMVAGFADVGSTLNGDGGVVDIRWADILKSANDAGLVNQLSRFDPHKCIPISLRILGTNLGDREPHMAIEVYDASTPPKPLYSSCGYKHSTDETSHVAGYPLFLLSSGQNMILHNPPKFTDELSAYWHLNLGLLERGVEQYRNPSTGDRFRLVKKNSRAAAMLDYALSVKNNAVVPRLLQNKSYCLSDDPSLLKIPEKMYQDVHSAYRTKLESINGQSYNLSKLRFKLKPLALSRDYIRSHPVGHAHAMFELITHAPQVVDPNESDASYNWPAPMPMRRGADDDDDDEDDDDDDDL